MVGPLYALMVGPLYALTVFMCLVQTAPDGSSKSECTLEIPHQLPYDFDTMQECLAVSLPSAARWLEEHDEVAGEFQGHIGCGKREESL